MLSYEIVDGPLAGQSLLSDGAHAEGEVVAIEVVDLAPGTTPWFDYVVESRAGAHGPGRLRHVPADPSASTSVA